jgi:hypothetical protein
LSSLQPTSVDEDDYPQQDKTIRTERDCCCLYCPRVAAESDRDARLDGTCSITSFESVCGKRHSCKVNASSSYFQPFCRHADGDSIPDHFDGVVFLPRLRVRIQSQELEAWCVWSRLHAVPHSHNCSVACIVTPVHTQGTKHMTLDERKEYVANSLLIMVRLCRHVEICFAF